MRQVITLPLDQPIRSSIFWPNLESSLLHALFLGSTDHFCFRRAKHNKNPANSQFITMETSRALINTAIGQSPMITNCKVQKYRCKAESWDSGES